MVNYITLLLNAIPLSSIWNYITTFITYWKSIIGLGSILTVISIVLGIRYRYLDRKNKEKETKERYFEVYDKSENLRPDDFNIAEYREEYWKFEELDIIPNLLNNKKNFIITGRASSGKTRSIYEYLKALKGFKIIKFYSDRIIKLEEIPDKFLKGKTIIFLDDLDEYVNKLNLKQLTKKLDSNDSIIVATCVNGNNYDKAEEEFGYLKNIFEEISIKDNKVALAIEISKQLKDLDLTDFDGTIGSMFLKLKTMQRIYNDKIFWKESKILFELIKLFAYSGLPLVLKDTLKLVYLEKIELEHFNPDNIFDVVLDNLKGYSLIITKKELIGVMHGNYLQISKYTPSLSDLDWLKSLLIEIKDEIALYNLGAVFSTIENKYHDSIECINKVLELNPLNGNAWNIKGVSLDNLSEYDDAIISFNKALEIEPENFHFITNKGYSLHLSGKNEDSIEWFDKAIELEPEYELTWINKGVTLRELERYDEAVKCFKKANQINPDNFKLYYEISYLLLLNNQYEDSIKWFDKTLSLDPEYEDALINKGIALMNLSRYDDALVCFDNAIDLKPNDPELLYRKAYLLLLCGKCADSVKWFDKILELDPEYELAWTNKEIALRKLMRYKEAIECLQKVIELKPDTPRLYREMGHLLFLDGNYEDSIEWFDKVIRLDPDCKIAYVDKGASLKSLEKNDEAIKCFNKAIELDPKCELAWVNKGASLSILKKYDEALVCFDKVLELNPNHDLAYTNKGSVLLYQGKIDESIENYEKALDINPNNDLALNNLTIALTKLDEF